jgi:predicted transcriptional regulator
MVEKIEVEVRKIKMTKQGSVGDMATVFGVTRQQVSRALIGLQNSEMCQKIREYALKNGGIEYVGTVKIRKTARPKQRLNRILAQRFGVTTQTVRNARKGITKTELAEKIRQAATELGGNVNYENINI